MIAPSLLAELKARGLVVKTSATGKELVINGAKGALTDILRGAIRDHRDELLELVFSLEERAALMAEIENPTPRDLERTYEDARRNVIGGMAKPDGELWRDEYRRRELDHLGVTRAFKDLEIVSVDNEKVKAA